jgi:hypothetical protein
VLLSLAGAVSSRDEGATERASGLAFSFAGCARVRPGPLCEVGEEREVTLWVPGSSKPQVGSTESVRETLFIEGGWRMKLRVPAGARELRIAAGGRRGRLRVADSSEPGPLRELARLWKDGKWEQVRASLDRAAAELTGPEHERIRAFRARLSMRDGNHARAASELEQTAESARDAGLLLEASHDRFAAAYIRTVRLGEYDRARADLAATERELGNVREVQARLAYNRGILAKTTGDLESALVSFRSASVESRRLDLSFNELASRQELARILNLLRRYAEALAEQRAIVAREEDSSCLRSIRLQNLAWILLSQSDPKVQQSGSSALDRAERLYDQCPDPFNRRIQALTRVELALLRGDVDEAERRLETLDSDPSGRDTRLSAWQALYTGKVRLLRGDTARAIVSFEQAATLAESIQLEDCSYLAKLGRARSLSERGDPGTLAAYLETEDAVDALVRSAPFGQGQQLTALQSQESSRELLSLLLARNQVENAYALAARVARRLWASNLREGRIAALVGRERQRWDRAIAEYLARRQTLQRTAEDDWKLSAESLAETRFSRELEVQRVENALAEAYSLLSPEPAPDLLRQPSEDAELTLSAGSEGWWLLFRRGESLTAERLPDINRGLVSALERLDRQKLLEAPLLRVAVPPELAALDIHALEVNGRRLIERLPVAYVLEPGRPPELRPAEGRPWTALVLGDPNDDLPWANSEAKRLSQRFPVARALFGDQVTFDAVTSALPAATLLHFAGHASSGGLDGLDGALRFSGGERLSLGDVFALRRVPDFVVLSACTSSVSPGSGGGLSIGQAFVAGGSRAVIGASRSVSDRLAQNFMQALYDALLGAEAQLPSDVRAWAAAFRVASMKVNRDDPNADWASMRLLLP